MLEEAKKALEQIRDLNFGKTVEDSANESLEAKRIAISALEKIYTMGVAGPDAVKGYESVDDGDEKGEQEVGVASIRDMAIALLYRISDKRYEHDVDEKMVLRDLGDSILVACETNNAKLTCGFATQNLKGETNVNEQKNKNSSTAKPSSEANGIQ